MIQVLTESQRTWMRVKLMCFQGFVQVRSLAAQLCTYQSPSGDLPEPLARQEGRLGQKHSDL